MKSATVLALLASLAVLASSAAMADYLRAAPGSVVLADWQYPQLLPPRFRNHCGVDEFSGRPYCADRCGSGYQFFYCSESSFGCCHLGRGYCGRDGVLRCSP